MTVHGPRGGMGGRLRNLWLSDIEFAHAGAQGAAVEPKGFSRAVLAADLPMGLFENPDNVFALDPASKVLWLVLRSLNGFLSSSTKRSLGPDELITSRSRTFSNSRTFPGQ